MAFPHLYAFTFLSSFPIIIGDISQGKAAVAIDQLATDGELFVKRIVHGEKLSEKPGYLLFTAPFKLCEGNCKDSESNFAMAFPIYVGKKGKEKYKEMYERDYHKIHSTKPNLPFKKRSTIKLFTLCPSKVTNETPTDSPTIDQPTVSETEATLAETPAKANLEELKLSEVEKPEFTETETTATKDIWFGPNSDMVIENDESDYVTKAKGVKCPKRICSKKIKVTAEITKIVNSDGEGNGKPDMRNAQRNNEYADLIDSLYSLY